MVLELQEKLKVSNPDWLMSTREKLTLIGLLHCLRPKRVIEFGYHRGGATKWLSELSGSVITVDVNEFVSDGQNQFTNVESWNCPTLEAIEKIKQGNLFFDLAIIDADHSRRAVAEDVEGLLKYADIVLMHDSFNPACRQGMLDSLTKQKTHAYYLDFMPSVNKHDGLWGGLAIAWKSENSGSRIEFNKEHSPFTPLALQHSLRIGLYFQLLKQIIYSRMNNIKNRIKILGGKIWGR